MSDSINEVNPAMSAVGSLAKTASEVAAQHRICQQRQEYGSKQRRERSKGRSSQFDFEQRKGLAGKHCKRRPSNEETQKRASAQSSRPVNFDRTAIASPGDIRADNQNA